MQKSGYSIVEVFGVVALVLTLMVVAIPSLRNFQDGGKQGAAVRNASALNSAVQQFDQVGGLLTAQVHVPPGVENITNPQDLPEFAVLNLLRGDDSGGQVSAWQEPVFDDKGYRVIWVNPLDTQQALREGLSGNRSELAEGLVAAGEGGRFEVIDDEGGRLGIVGFRRGDVDAALLVANTTFESPTPTPATTNGAPTASLTVNPPTAQVGETFTYIANGSDPDNDPLSFTFTHIGGTSPTSGNRVFNRSYGSPGTYTVTVLVSDGSLISQAQATVNVTAAPGAPSVTLDADIDKPHRGQVVTFTATGTDPEGEALTYQFIKDGTIVQDGPSNTFSTQYAELGPKSVAVAAIDPTKLSAGAEKGVVVENRNPVGALSVLPPVVDVKLPVKFVVAASDPDGDALFYRFNIDGEWTDWSKAAELVKIWSTPGVRPVLAEVKDEFGGTARQMSDRADVRLPSFVFYWNQGVHPDSWNKVIDTEAQAKEKSNFDLVMKAIMDAGREDVELALEEEGFLEALSAVRTAQGPETVTGGPWSVVSASTWVHAPSFVEAERRRRGRGYATYRRQITDYYTYQRTNSVRQMTGESTVSEYQTRTYSNNAILGINIRTGEIVAVPTDSWANVVAGNMTLGEDGITVEGYAKMGNQGEEFLLRQYQANRQWQEQKSEDALIAYSRSVGNWWHPVTISFKEGGDFLSGEWRKLKDREARPEAMRMFNLDGSGKKLWEWVGPTEGILVVNEAKNPMFQPDGTHFFGHNTWGRKWENATEPMRTLDANNDGYLTDAELEVVWIWVDANSDAVVQYGEMTLASERGINSLSVNNESDGKGGEWFPKGATGPAGEFDMVDWWSLTTK